MLATVAYFLGQEGGNLEESLNLFADAIKVDPHNSLYMMRYARLLRKAGKVGQAELMYKAALKHSERNNRLHPMALCNYATFLFQIRKNFDAANELFDYGLKM